jgi:hypothetical protein
MYVRCVLAKSLINFCECLVTIQELWELWEEYTKLDDTIQYGTVPYSMEYSLFSKVFSSTFSEWGVDNTILRRLFCIIDKNKDDRVDFVDIMKCLSGMSYCLFHGGFFFMHLLMLFSVICRGKFEDKAKSMRIYLLLIFLFFLIICF